MSFSDVAKSATPVTGLTVTGGPVGVVVGGELDQQWHGPAHLAQAPAGEMHGKGRGVMVGVTAFKTMGHDHIRLMRHEQIAQRAGNVANLVGGALVVNRQYQKFFFHRQ